MAASPSGSGYWLMGLDGGVFSCGDAPFRGSAAGIHTPSFLATEFVAIDRSATGGGYWLVTWTGAIFPFGDAGFLTAFHNTRIVVGFAATSTGEGYWLALAPPFPNQPVFGPPPVPPPPLVPPPTIATTIPTVTKPTTTTPTTTAPGTSP